MTSSRDTVREALEKMGGFCDHKSGLYALDRIGATVVVSSQGLDKRDAILFAGECKAYLREKGFTGFDLFFGSHVVLDCSPDTGQIITVDAPTEHEAWAKAVLSASEGEG